MHDFDARARRLALLRAVGIAGSVFVLWMLACCGIDRLLQLPSTIRLSLLATGVLAVTVLLAKPLRRALRRRVDWAEAADRIERHSPQFGQRLVTVASRVLGPAEHRGSDDMLRELLRDVDRQVAAQDATALLPLRRIARPWLVFMAAVVAGLGLARVPALGMDVLVTRFLVPLADVEPVTTTYLEVLTGARDVIQSEPLRVEAHVANVGTGVVSLHVSEDGGGHWSRSTMLPMNDEASLLAGGASTAPSTPGLQLSSRGDPARVRPAAHDATRYAFTLASVDRDLRYRVTAGDATSRTYTVRVRRPPAVERFRVHYEYPAHTGRAALTVVNTDGVIEAPTGTRATLTIVATEPLDDALLTFAGERTMMRPPAAGEPLPAADAAAAAEGRVRQASFVVRKDGKYELVLISDREVPGGGPGTTTVRATPDGKPLVRLSQAGDNLRLHPREILPLGYEALDDYGIGRLVLRAQVNSAAPLDVPIPLQPDPRRQADEHEFDLATMPLGIGDVVTLRLVATDRAGQSAASEAVQVLVSPRSVDLATYQRVEELNSAAALAATLHENLTAAAQALDEVDREAAAKSLAYLAARNRATRALAGAAESATLMRQSLYRAVVNSRSPELSTTLSSWIDVAQVQSWLAEDLFRRGGAPKGMGDESRGLLGRSLETTRVLRDELKAVAAGERAAAVLADRENLLASQRKADAAQDPEVKQRLVQTLQRAQEDIAAGAKEIGLDPAAGDLDAQLKARVDGAAALLAAKQPVDFTAGATEWSQELQRDATRPVVLDERLGAAAQAEAVRPDGDLVRAADLQLAGRAAARIEALAQSDPGGTSAGPVAFNELATAVAAVQREHAINRRPTDVRPPAEVEGVRDGAAAARAVLRRWAGEAPLAESSTRPALASRRPGQQHAEDLALRASAEAASRNYDEAEALDEQMARELREAGGASSSSSSGAAGGADVWSSVSAAAWGPVGPPVPFARIEQQQQQVRRAMDKARTLDDVGEKQDTVAQQTQAAQPEQAPNLAGKQRDVAEAIGRVNDDGPAAAPPGVGAGDVAAVDPNFRGRAAAAVLAAQETLAAMPQQLAAVQEALRGWRDAVARAEQAKRDAAAMPGERQPAAERAAAQADRDAAGAAERFEKLRRPVGAAAVGDLSRGLQPFAPETDGACGAIGRALVPALQRMDEASKAGDAGAFARSADEARQAIEAVQKELATAQEALTARDPLVAAKWFARAAADSLARTPPDLRGAQVRQRETSAALSRAWDRTIHDAAAMRLAVLPGMRSLYAPEAGGDLDAAGATAVAGAGGAPMPDAASLRAPGLAAVREWARLRTREPQDLNASLRDSEPVGFEEPLRLYFEALGKSRNEPPK